MVQDLQHNSRIKWIYSQMVGWLRFLLNKTDGATAVEYGIMVAAIAAAIIAVVMILGGDLNSTFKEISKCLEPPPGNGGNSSPNTPPQANCAARK